MSTVKSFNELEIWQLAIDLDKKIHELIQTEIIAKNFAFKDQINRSAGSIADNIAEGFGRGGRLEFIQFLSIAKGSTSEVQSQLTRGLNRKLLSQELFDQLSELTQKTGNKIGSFIKYLNQSDIKGPKFQNRIPINEKQETTNKKQETRNDNEKPETRNDNKKPETRNEKQETRNERRETRNDKQETRNERRETRNDKQETRNEKPETRNEKPETRNERRETRNERRETRNDKQETRNEKPETRNEKPETRNEKQETRNEIISTNNAATPLGAYPHARKAGNLLFLSGIGSRSAGDNSIPGLVLDEEGNKVSYDIEAECHTVFKNVKAVLEASGSSWDKIIDVTVFLTNMKKDFPVYNRVYGEYFERVQACRTTVEVLSLPTPIAIELKVIALVD